MSSKLGLGGGFKKFMARMKEDPFEHFLDALALGFNADYEEAIEKIDRAIYLTNEGYDKIEKATLLMLKGLAYYHIENYKESLSAFEQSIKLNPKNFSVWNAKGVTLIESEKYEEALSSFETALRYAEKEDLPLAWTNMGYVLNELDRFEEALEVCIKALESDPAIVDAWYDKSYALSELGNHDEALVACEEGLKLDKEDLNLLVQKGIVMLDLKRNDEALTYFEHATKLDPTDELAWYNKACTLSILNRGEDAVDALIVATSLEPENLLEMVEEEDFENIRKLDRFKKLASQIL
ncbi:hypothetical protein NSIN_20284 [Nitrosotalea sinensis]|uniref:Uncharacterized protein n=1 Tax=Nitrosotalea sinensis TaxID=1499975 RepID=A0A2H1EFU3_9ARCH|nr:hypothetical protein NSIN_20284 [Candidatus Nitrosotalea sinensis]